jgi:hypothetical protein
MLGNVLLTVIDIEALYYPAVSFYLQTRFTAIRKHLPSLDI